MAQRRPVKGTFPWMKLMLEHPEMHQTNWTALCKLYIEEPRVLKVILTHVNSHLTASDLLWLLSDERFNLDSLTVILSTWDLREEFTADVLAASNIKRPHRMLINANILAFHKFPRINKHRLAVSWNDSRESPAHLYVTLRLLAHGWLQFGATTGTKFVRFATMIRRLPGELQQRICCRAMCFEAAEHRSWSCGDGVREESYGNALLYWLHGEGANRI
jgi:hypothetical protein